MLFASPLYLLGALGAAIPVLIHLYGRRKARRVLFPSLMLIQAAQRERTSLVRLRQMWLMLLRAAAILLLSLGLARPTLPWLSTAGNPEGQTIVLLDDSLSMRTRGAGRTRFDIARTAAGSMMEKLSPGQRMAVALASEPERLQYLDGRAFEAALPALQPSYAAADIPQALATLAQQLPAGRSGRQWYLLTDLQATGWIGTGTAGLDANDLVTVIDCGQEIANHAVTAPVVQEPPALVSRPVRLAAQVRQYGQAAAPLEVRLTIGNGQLPPLPVTPRKGEAQALFDWQPEQAGDVALSVSLPPDALREDDVAWQVVDARRRLSVALRGAPEQTRWVAAALHPGAESPVEAFSGLPQSDTDATVAWSLDHPDELKRFADTGGGVLLFAGDLQQTALDGLLGPQALKLGPLRSVTTPVHLASFDAFHAPLQAFANPAAGDLQAASFSQYRELALPPQSPLRVLATYDDGTPAILEGASGQGRLIIANFGVTPQQGDLPSQEVFVPLMHRLVGYLSRRPWPHLDELTAGESRALSPPEEAHSPVCTGPEDTPVAVQAEAHAWRLRPEAPGVYKLRWQQAGRPMSTLFAVNVDPAESDPTRLAPTEVGKRLQPSQVRVITPAQATQAMRRTPLSLATPLLVLAFLLLLAELLLTQAGGSRRHGEG